MKSSDEIQLDQRPDRREGTGTDIEHPRPHPDAQLLSRPRQSGDAGRHARIRLRPGTQVAGRCVDRPRLHLPSGARAPAARLHADRQPARHQGCRPEDDGSSRPGGGQLPDRPDQDRQDQAGRRRTRRGGIAGADFQAPGRISLADQDVIGQDGGNCGPARGDSYACLLVGKA